MTLVVGEECGSLIERDAGSATAPEGIPMTWILSEHDRLHLAGAAFRPRAFAASASHPATILKKPCGGGMLLLTLLSPARLR